MIMVRETEYFKAWIRGLKNKQTKQIINARIRRISARNFGDSKPVGGGVSELRINYGHGYQVYYIRRTTELVILLCGSDKSTQDETIMSAKKIAENLEEV